MPEPMAGTAQGDKIFGLVATALDSGGDVVDFEEAGPGAARGLAAVLIAGENFSAGLGRDGCGITFAVLANGCVATDSFCIGSTQFTFTGLGLDGHLAIAIMDVDLDRRPAGEDPQGGLFL